MKIIKKSLLLTAGLLAGNMLMAQDLEPKIAKPVPELAPAVDNKPNPVLQGIASPSANRNDKQPGTESKVPGTTGPAPSDTKDEGVKPKLVPQTIPLIQSASTVSSDKRVNGSDAPPRVLPEQNTQVTPPPPVKAELKKPASVQQQPGHN